MPLANTKGARFYDTLGCCGNQAEAEPEAPGSECRRGTPKIPVFFRHHIPKHPVALHFAVTEAALRASQTRLMQGGISPQLVLNTQRRKPLPGHTAVADRRKFLKHEHAFNSMPQS